MYDALIRNGYFLPSLKSTLITEAYLRGVMEGRVYCPKTEMIKLKGCPSPPSKDILLTKFIECLIRRGIEDHGIDQNHKPDSKWLISVLATLSPEDEIYRKDYRPPPRLKKIEEQKTILVPSAFLAGLP